MTGTGSHTGGSIGDTIRKGVGMVHGTGEAIRGNINAAVDSATGNHESAQRQQNIAARGADEFQHGHYHGTGAGVTPADTEREPVNRAAQGESGPVGSTNYGPHATNVGNKIDPRVDSDVDHRGTVSGSTNQGPHSTNVGNKMDPRFDSDADHRGNVSGSMYQEPPPTNAGTRVDPRVNNEYLAPQYDGSTDPTRPTDSSERSNLPPQSAVEHEDPDKRSDSGISSFHGATALKMRRASHAWLLSHQQPSEEAEPELDPKSARRFSHDDRDTTRTNTIKILKRTGTEPHAVLNNVFASSPVQILPDPMSALVRLNDPSNERNTKPIPTENLQMSRRRE